MIITSLSKDTILFKRLSRREIEFKLNFGKDTSHVMQGHFSQYLEETEHCKSCLYSILFENRENYQTDVSINPNLECYGAMRIYSLKTERGWPRFKSLCIINSKANVN